eukprot:518705-Pelagomonas_calceolata.AAC.2
MSTLRALPQHGGFAKKKARWLKRAVSFLHHEESADPNWSTTPPRGAPGATPGEAPQGGLSVFQGGPGGAPEPPRKGDLLSCPSSTPNARTCTATNQTLISRTELQAGVQRVRREEGRDFQRGLAQAACITDGFCAAGTACYSLTGATWGNCLCTGNLQAEAMAKQHT